MLMHIEGQATPVVMYTLLQPRSDVVQSGIPIQYAVGLGDCKNNQQWWKKQAEKEKKVQKCKKMQSWVLQLWYVWKKPDLSPFIVFSQTWLYVQVLIKFLFSMSILATFSIRAVWVVSTKRCLVFLSSFTVRIAFLQSKMCMVSNSSVFYFDCK